MTDTHGLARWATRLAQQLCDQLGPPAHLSEDYSGYLYVPIILSSNHVLGVFHSTLTRPDRSHPELPYLEAILVNGHESRPTGLHHRWSLTQPDSIDQAIAWARTVMYRGS